MRLPTRRTGALEDAGPDQPVSLQREPMDKDLGPPRTPLYPRLLRLRHIHPAAWQRAVLGEGMALVGGVLALADLASAWTVVVLPVAVGVVVKAHDVLAGALAHPDPRPATAPAPSGAGRPPTDA